MEDLEKLLKIMDAEPKLKALIKSRELLVIEEYKKELENDSKT